MPIFRPSGDVYKMRDKGDIKGLIKALGYKRKKNGPDVSGHAANCIREIGKPAVEPLIRALRHKNWVVYKTAADILGEIGDARAVEPLIAALKDKDKDVRKLAAKALDNIGDTRAVEPLIAAIKDKDKEVRLSAALALGNIGDPRAVEPLIAAITDKDKDVRMYAARALGDIGDTRAVEPLIAALKDEHKSVRSRSARALKKIGAPAVEPLIAAIKDKDGDVHKSAAEALGYIGAPAVEPLIAALTDKNAFVRQAVAEVLERIDDPRARQQLAAIRKWFKKKVPKATLDRHIAALKSSSTTKQLEAAKALVQIGDARAVKHLVAVAGILNPRISSPGRVELGKAAAEALVQIGSEAVEPLIAVLGEGKIWSHWSHRRETVAIALGQIGDARAVEPLISVFDKECASKSHGVTISVQAAICKALGKIGTVRAKEALGVVIAGTYSMVGKRLPFSTHASDVRSAAIYALRKLGPPPPKSLIDALNNKSIGSWDRSKIARLLCSIGDTSAVEPLTTALKDGDSDVRRYAAAALDAISKGQ